MNHMMMFSALQFASIAASSSVGSWLRQGDLRSSMLNFRLTFTFVIPLRKYTHSAVLAKVQRMEKTLLAFYQLSRSRDGMNDKRLNPSPIQITSQAFSGPPRSLILSISVYLPWFHLNIVRIRHISTTHHEARKPNSRVCIRSPPQLSLSTLNWRCL